MANPYRQQVTYWGRSTPDGFGGWNYLAPQYYAARWEDVQEQFLTPLGELTTSRAVVFMPAAFVSGLVVGGYLFLGLSTEANPTEVADAFAIRQIVKIPDMRNVRQESRFLL